MTPIVTPFFDVATNTVSYVVQDPNGRAAAIVDSVLDFDYASGRTDTRSADAVIAFVRDNDLTVEWLLETSSIACSRTATAFISASCAATCCTRRATPRPA